MTRARLLTIGLLAGAAAAFALAIRSEVRGDHAGEPAFDPLSIDPVERDRARARADMTATEDREARAAQAADADDALAHQLAGPRPGQPGPLFDAVRFGSFGVAIAPADFARLHDAAAADSVDIYVDGDALFVVMPDRVADRIYRAWSDPPRDRPLFDAPRAAVVRSHVESNRVRFTWAPYETMAHMIAPGDRLGETPFSIVGAHLDDVKALLGPDVTGDTWRLPPLEDGAPGNMATLTIAGGVVTRVSVIVLGSADDVAAALRTAYGDAPHDGPWRHGALTITFDGHPDGAMVTAALAP